MSVKVRIPAPLRKLTQNKTEIEANGKTVQELVEDLEKKFPGMKERLCDETGKIRRFINIYVNEQDIRFLENENTPLKKDDEVSIIPAIAGGELVDGQQFPPLAEIVYRHKPYTIDHTPFTLIRKRGFLPSVPF